MAVTSVVPSSTNVLLALGSNIGRSSLTLSRAIQSLRLLPSTTLVSTSHMYHTPPAYVITQPSFMNAACHIRTSLSPTDLLAQLKDMERNAGRDFNGVRNGPRPLDIDIILYGDTQLTSSSLTIPHARMAERDFVLAPLADIAGSYRHPQLKRTIDQLWNRCQLASTSSTGIVGVRDEGAPPNEAPVIRVIAMPADTNPAGDIFGGWLMSWMDLAAGTVAARRSQGRAATLKADAMAFLRPVAVGDEVSFYADLVSEGRSSMKIHVEAWRRLRHGDDTVKVTEATFTWVAIGSSGKSRALPSLSNARDHGVTAVAPPLLPGFPLPKPLRRGPPRVMCINPYDEHQLLWTWGSRTHIMGVVNVTPDSFSDGGDYNSTEGAINHALSLSLAGADIIDIGGESTRPGAVPITSSEEMERIIPVIKGIRQRGIATPISVDTYRADVAREAIAAGGNMINDVSGGTWDNNMLATVAMAGVPYSLMHTRGTPADMQHIKHLHYHDVVSEVRSYLEGRVSAAEAAGIPRWNIIADPGLGFAKNVSQNLSLIRNVNSARPSVGTPMLVGSSRKGFISRILERDFKIAEVPISDRIAGTAATVTAGIESGADIVRVHDVSSMRGTVAIADALYRSSL